MEIEEKTIKIDIEFLRRKLFDDDYMSPDEAEYIFGCVLQSAVEASDIDFEQGTKEVYRLAHEFHLAKQPHHVYEECRQKDNYQPHFRDALKSGLLPIGYNGSNNS